MRRRTNEPETELSQTMEVDLRDQSYAPPAPAANEITVIGDGARLEGNLISAGSLKIEGNVKGHVTAEGDVVVSSEASVEADILAANVTIAGKYKGNVTATGNLELASSARVEGNISCGSLTVARGAVFSGQSTMGGERQPSRVAASVEKTPDLPVEEPAGDKA